MCIPILTLTVVSLFLPLLSPYSFNLWHLTPVFRKAIIRAPRSSPPPVYSWKRVPRLFERETLQSGATVSALHSPNSPLSAGLARLPPGTSRAQCLRPKHFPVSKPAEHKAKSGLSYKRLQSHQVKQFKRRAVISLSFEMWDSITIFKTKFSLFLFSLIKRYTFLQFIIKLINILFYF